MLATTFDAHGAGRGGRGPNFNLFYLNRLIPKQSWQITPDRHQKTHLFLTV